MKPLGDVKWAASSSLGRVVSLFSGPGEDDTFREIEGACRSEGEQRKARRTLFETRFPRTARIPLVGRTGKLLFAEGGVNLALLLAILILFTAIKAPYFGLPFTGEHPTKYNTYVEPALYMSQTNNPLLYMKKYVADPVTNPDGALEKFDHLPLFEWGLFLTYEAVPFGSLETRTRLFTHLVGLGMLVCAYLFFARWLPAKLALLVVAMMSINPVIVFGTYVTVLDSLALLCMFLSFAMLNGYFEEKEPGHLFRAGIAFGIGCAVKYSLFLWMAPISLLLMYWNRERAVVFLRDALIYGFLGMLVIVTFKTSITTMIASPLRSSAFLLAWAGVYGVLYRLVRRKESRILRGVEVVWENKVYLSIGILGVLLAGFGAFSMLHFGDYGDEYLTDASIAFNPRLYKYMLLDQFKEYMTRTIFWLGICGLALVLGVGNSRSRRLVAAFLAGSVAYWVAAAKALFFHNYYTLIIMILFSLSASFVLYYTYRNMASVGAKAAFVFLFCALILPPVHDATAAKLGRYDRVEEAVKFIREHTEEGDFILYEGWLAPLVIYTGRGFVKPATLVSDTIREEIRTLGFAATMRKYRIRYFFSPYGNPSYKDFAPLFAKTRLIEPGGRTFNRNLSIQATLGQFDPGAAEGLKEAEEVERAYDIPGRFKLVGTVGKYRFYSFLD